MSHLQIRPFRPSDQDTVIALWHSCGLIVPQNDPVRDIARKLQVNPELFLIGELEGLIVGTCMAGYEGHRGWINYLAVHPAYQRRGFARSLMHHAESLLRTAGCPKINLQVRNSNRTVIGFYQALGFATDEAVSMGKRLESDEL